MVRPDPVFGRPRDRPDWIRLYKRPKDDLTEMVMHGFRPRKVTSKCRIYYIKKVAGVKTKRFKGRTGLLFFVQKLPSLREKFDG